MSRTVELEMILNEASIQFDSIPSEKWIEKKKPSAWSKLEILGHLVDSAMNNMRRCIVSQYEENQKIVYRQDEWVTYQDYKQADPAQLIQLWKLLNIQFARTINAIPPDKLLNRCDTGKGIFESHTLEFIIADYVVHLKHHLEELLPGFFATK